MLEGVPPADHTRRSRSHLARGYLLCVALGWLLGDYVGERTLPTLLLAYAPPVLWLLPAPLVWLWVLLRRRRIGTVLLATLLALWGAGFFHWKPQQAAAPDKRLRVLTYNVARGTMTSPERLANFLKSTDADVILLQETNFVQGGFAGQLEAYLPDYTSAHGTEVAVLSRLPMQSARTFPLPQMQREVLVLPLSWQGHTLNVVNAHLSAVLLSPLLRGDLAPTRRTRNARDEQVELLRQIALQTEGPILLGGDLNTPPRGLVYRRLQGMYGPDAFDRAGRGPGWTFPSFKLRIDHQMTRDLTPVRAQVWPGAGSDHRPLLVEYHE